MASNSPSVPEARRGRTFLSVIAGYLTNAALVGISEIAYVRWLDVRMYFVVDVVTQIVATIIGGYICCRIAQHAKRVAATSLMALGLTIGTISFVTSCCSGRSGDGDFGSASDFTNTRDHPIAHDTRRPGSSR